MNDTTANAITSIEKVKTCHDMIEWMKQNAFSEDVTANTITNLTQLSTQFGVTHPNEETNIEIKTQDFGTPGGLDMYAGAVFITFPTNFRVGFMLTILNQKVIDVEIYTPSGQ